MKIRPIKCNLPVWPAAPDYGMGEPAALRLPVRVPGLSLFITVHLEPATTKKEDIKLCSPSNVQDLRKGLLKHQRYCLVRLKGGRKQYQVWDSIIVFPSKTPSISVRSLLCGRPNIIKRQLQLLWFGIIVWCFVLLNHSESWRMTCLPLNILGTIKSMYLAILGTF